MKRKTKGGTASVELPIYVQDTSSTTGAGLPGLAYNTAGLVAEYRRQGQSTWQTITLVAGTLGTFVSSGFIADGTLAGAYALCPPDAALAAGVRWVAIRLYGAANMKPVLIEIELDAVDYQDANAFGLARIDAAITTRSTFAGGSVASVTAPVTVGTNNDKTGYAMTAAEHTLISGTDVPAALTAQGLTGARAAKLDNLDAAVSTRSTFAGGAVASVTGNVGGNVAGSVGSVTSPVALADASIKTATFATGATCPKVTLVDTTTDLTNGGGGGSSITIQDILDATPTFESQAGNTTPTISDCMAAIYVMVCGKQSISPTSPFLFNQFCPDGTTVFKSLTLDSATAPTTRA